MKKYLVHDLEGASFMDYSHPEGMTAAEIRSQRYDDYKNNHDPEDNISWKHFTLALIADLWNIEFEEVKA